MPHVLLKEEGLRRSTTDISGRSMVLLATPQAHLWVRAVKEAADALGVPLEVTLFTPPCTEEEAARLWQTAFGVGVERAVLARPDGHIAWITPAEDANPAARAAEVLGQILDRSVSMGHAYGTTRMRRAQRRSA